MKENIRRAILQDQDIYLCVPMRDRLDYKVPENQKRAERYAADIMERYDCKVIAPRRICPICLTRMTRPNISSPCGFAGSS